METIKTTIIKYLEGQGRASKSKIEDYIKETVGTTGDTCSRRIRELVAEGIVRKDQKEYQGKKYWEYSVVDQDPHKIGLHGAVCMVGQDRDICVECKLPVEQTEKLNL
mgnify:CR=1 FL=1